MEQANELELRPENGTIEEIYGEGSAFTRGARRTTSKIWYVIGICLALLVMFILIGSVLTIGDHLMSANTALGIAFYVLVVALVVVGIIYPIVRVFTHPVFSLYRLHDQQGRAKMRWCRRLANNLIENAELTTEERMTVHSCLQMGDEADDLLIDFFNAHIVPTLDAETRSAAKAVFFATAISRSSLVDIVTMLTINFNLVKAIVERCGFRPTTAALWRLYSRVMLSALVAAGLEDMDLDVLLGNLMGGGTGARISGSLLSSATQGTINAFLVYRVGIMTKRYLCSDKGAPNFAKLRRVSYGEALRLMRTSGFMTEVLSSLRSKTTQVATSAVSAVRTAATDAGRAAASTVASAVSTAADAVKSRVVSHSRSEQEQSGADDA